MQNKTLHIVSFNTPYPPNYGGIIDVFYKLKALSAKGIVIYLHCFDYGRGEQKELEKYCEKIFYYKRKTDIQSQISKFPYIVNSRKNKNLLNNLCMDEAPILFEGLHSTYFASDDKLANRIKLIRTHNVEHEYYNLLARDERNLLKKAFFKLESWRLKNFEPILNTASAIACISRNDKVYFKNKYEHVFWLPPFHPNKDVDIILDQLGDFALYHGNLSVRENIQSALFIIEAFKNKEIKIILAGKNPSKELYKAANRTTNISIESNLSEQRMVELIKTAQVHLLPTFQPTGIKLKLMSSLYIGKHCIANKPMIEGTGLEQLCHKAETSEDFYKKAMSLMGIPFGEKDIIARKEILNKHFDNERNANLLISKLFE